MYILTIGYNYKVALINKLWELAIQSIMQIYENQTMFSFQT